MNKKFNKALLVPILTGVALIVKQVFKVDIPDLAVDIAADLIMGGISLAGMFMHPKVDVPQTNGGVTNESTQHTNTFESNR